MTIYSLAVAGVQKLIPYKAGKPIEELERELGLTQIIKLASNENPFGAGKKAIAAIQAALPELGLYPDGSGFRLKKALAKKYALDAEQITLGNGSNEILELVARAFVTPDLEVIFSQHAFAVYPIVTQAVGATAVVVPALKEVPDPYYGDGEGFGRVLDLIEEASVGFLHALQAKGCIPVTKTN